MDYQIEYKPSMDKLATLKNTFARNSGQQSVVTTDRLESTKAVENNKLITYS